MVLRKGSKILVISENPGAMFQNTMANHTSECVVNKVNPKSYALYDLTLKMGLSIRKENLDKVIKDEYGTIHRVELLEY